MSLYKTMMIKRNFLLFIPCLLLLVACNRPHEEVVPMGAESKVIDSLTAMRLHYERLEADEQLDKRLSIEVKQKADSIFQAISKGDTFLHVPEPRLTDSTTVLPVSVPEAPAMIGAGIRSGYHHDAKKGKDTNAVSR